MDEETAGGLNQSSDDALAEHLSAETDREAACGFKETACRLQESAQGLTDSREIEQSCLNGDLYGHLATVFEESLPVSLTHEMSGISNEVKGSVYDTGEEVTYGFTEYRGEGFGDYSCDLLNHLDEHPHHRLKDLLDLLPEPFPPARSFDFEELLGGEDFYIGFDTLALRGDETPGLGAGLFH